MQTPITYTHLESTAISILSLLSKKRLSNMLKLHVKYKCYMHVVTAYNWSQTCFLDPVFAPHSQVINIPTSKKP